jgi:hypothetical protein
VQLFGLITLLKTQKGQDWKTWMKKLLREHVSWSISSNNRTTLIIMVITTSRNFPQMQVIDMLIDKEGARIF